MALAQLAAWQQVAVEWPLRLRITDSKHLRCADCHGPVVALLDANGMAYRVTLDQIRDGTVRHLRESHPEVEPPGLLGDIITC